MNKFKLSFFDLPEVSKQRQTLAMLEKRGPVHYYFARKTPEAWCTTCPNLRDVHESFNEQKIETPSGTVTVTSGDPLAPVTLFMGNQVVPYPPVKRNGRRLGAGGREHGSRGGVGRTQEHRDRACA